MLSLILSRCSRSISWNYLTIFQRLSSSSSSSSFAIQELFDTSYPNNHHENIINKLKTKTLDYCKAIRYDIEESRILGGYQNVMAIDELSNNLCSLVDLTSCLVKLHPDERMRRTSMNATREGLFLMNQLNNDSKLYSILVEYLSLDKTNYPRVHVGQSLLEEIDKVAKSLVADFKKAGLDLIDEEKRTVLGKLQNTISALSQVHDRLTIPHLFKLLEARHRMARLLGKSGYIDLIIDEKSIFDSGKELLNYLEDYLEKYIALNKTISIKKRLLSYKSERFLHLNDVMQMLVHYSWIHFKLAIYFNKLSENFINAPFPIIPIRFYSDWLSYRPDSTPLGTVYLYFQWEESNSDSPALYTLRTWRESIGWNAVYDSKEIQTPLLIISLKITAKKIEEGNSLLLSFKEAQSLFHEFGHAIHSICGRTKLHHLAGTRGCTEFLETPSKLMELVFMDEKAWKAFPLEFTPRIKNISTEIEQYRLEQEQFSDKCTQIMMAILDQVLHSDSSLYSDGSNEASLSTFLEKLILHPVIVKITKIMRIPPQQLLAQLPSFAGHLIQYGGTYYTYVLGEHLAHYFYYGKYDKHLKAISKMEQFKTDYLSKGGMLSLHNLRDVIFLSNHAIPN